MPSAEAINKITSPEGLGMAASPDHTLHSWGDQNDPKARRMMESNSNLAVTLHCGHQ